MGVDRFLRFDWLFIGVSDAEVVALCLLISVILFIWGGTMIAAAYLDTDRRRYRRWDPRSWMPPVFGYWLGVFMVCDATVYLLFANLVHASPARTVQMWVVLPVAALGVAAVIAFYLWGRGRQRP